MHIKLKIFILESISKPSVIGSPFQTYILITQFSISGSCCSQSIHIFNRTIFIYPLINRFSSFFIHPVHFHFFQHIDIITLVKSTSFSVHKVSIIQLCQFILVITKSKSRVPVKINRFQGMGIQS